MKNLAILLLLFFINCSSQQISTNKKYMDMETTFQKYRDIKAKYDTMVARNKQNLVYENGAYFDKAFYDKEAPEKRYVPEESPPAAQSLLTLSKYTSKISIKKNYL